MAHAAKFYGRLRLICSVLRASNFPCLKFIINCNIGGLLHHPLLLNLVFFSQFLYARLVGMYYGMARASVRLSVCQQSL